MLLFFLFLFLFIFVLRGETENTSKRNVWEFIETGRCYSYDCSCQITELVKKEKRKKKKKNNIEKRCLMDGGGLGEWASEKMGPELDLNKFWFAPSLSLSKL